jgi:hypothetical protein
MYKQIKFRGEVIGVYKEENGVRVSFTFQDPANTDYQEYLAWLSSGNVPLPPDEMAGNTVEQQQPTQEN